MAGAILTRILLLAALATAQRSQVQTSWGQCAGENYKGPTACPTAMVCTFGNPWYSQCVPGNLDEPLPGVPDVPIVTETQRTTVTVGGPRPTVVTTYITYLTPAPTSPATAPPPLPPTVTVIGGVTYTFVPDAPYTPPPLPPQKHVREPTAVAPRAPSPTTLQKGQYWIRAVASPNFHKYLQTKPANEPGTALIEDYRTAGQFNIVDGQLVESSGGATLYMNVEKPADLTQRALATWFNTTKNAFGTFAFQGDAVTWSTPEVKRQNLAAWLVCKGQALFINTGAYAYQTPSGCADQTIHYYNGDTANN